MAVNVSSASTNPTSVPDKVVAERLHPNLVKYTLMSLATVALTELVLWRSFTRIGAFIRAATDPTSPFQTIHQVGSEIGRITLNFTVALALAFIVIIMLRLRELGAYNAKSSGTYARLETLTVFMIIGITALQLYLVQNEVISLALRLTLLIAFGVMALDMWRRANSWELRLFTGLMYTAYAIQSIAKMLHDTPWLGETGEIYRINYYVPLLMAGEAVILLNAVVAWLAFGRNGANQPRTSHPRALAGGVILGLSFAGLSLVTMAQTAIVPILGLYALGFTMQWFMPFYAVAVGFLAYTIFVNLGRLSSGSAARSAAFGLILIFTGGYLFNISNQYILALVGVWLLARPELLENWTN